MREAALALFAERGFHGTALSEIAERLGVRTPSLYNHMSSKQELLHQILLETSKTVLAEFEASQETGSAPLAVSERLRLAVRVYAARHATHPREALIVNRDVNSLDEPARSEVLELRRAHEQALRALLNEGVREGELDIANPTLSSFAILEMCVSIARWFRPDGELQAEEVAEVYAEYALRIAGART